MSNDKKSPIYYLFSTKKIDPIPQSLERFKESIYYAGQINDDGHDLLEIQGFDLKHIRSFLELFGFEASTVACIKNMNESLLSEFILKETFEAIFFIEDEGSSARLRFVNRLSTNIGYINTDLQSSLDFLDECEEAVDLYGNKDILNYFQELSEEFNKIHLKSKIFNDKLLDYMKPDIIKYLKIS